MKIELRNWINREVIFSHECEGNSIKKTVEEAVKQGVSLAYAYLPGEDLSGGKLSVADFYMANLDFANLSDADLFEADLSDANLSEADLTGAKLTEADLTGANLSGAKCDESQKDIILKAVGLVFHEGNDSK